MTWIGDKQGFLELHGIILAYHPSPTWTMVKQGLRVGCECDPFPNHVLCGCEHISENAGQKSLLNLNP